MKISHEALPQSRLKYLVELTDLEVAEQYEHALSHLAPTVKVAGFRPGKAPSSVIRDQIKPESLREEAYSLAVQHAWRTITKDIKELPIEDPQVEVGEFIEGKPATLEFQFDIRPSLTLKDWQKISLKIEKLPDITDNDVAEVIGSLRRNQAKTTVKLTEAKGGDQVEVSFEGSIGGVKKEKLSARHFPIIIGQSSVIPGFEKELVGLKKNSQKTFSLPFPKEHFDKEFAGKSVEFQVTVDEVFDVLLPEVTDEFAVQFGHKTVAELTATIKADLEKQRKDDQFVSQKAQWLAEFEQKIDVEVPQSLVSAEVGRSRASWQQFLQERHLQAEDWLARQNLTIERLEKDWQKAATTSVKIGLGLAEIAKVQHRQLDSNDDFQTLLDELVQQALGAKA